MMIENSTTLTWDILHDIITRDIMVTIKRVMLVGVHILLCCFVTHCVEYFPSIGIQSYPISLNLDFG